MHRSRHHYRPASAAARDLAALIACVEGDDDEDDGDQVCRCCKLPVRWGERQDMCDDCSWGDD